MPIPAFYFLIFLLILQINVLPAFMPPTWLILAFFYLQFHLSLVPLVLVGACAATLGRILLAKLSGKYFRKHLPKRFQKNYLYVGDYFRRHNRLTIPFVISYAFLPIPSNQVFIAAGLAEVNLSIISISFLVGRLISYTFWVSVTSRVSENINQLFTQHLLSFDHILIELAGLLLVVCLGFINWRKLLH